MDILRARITSYLKKAFPELGDGVREFYGLDLAEGGHVQIPAEGILVSAIQAAQADSSVGEPWSMRVDFGLTCAVKAASAIERDKLGWNLALRVCDVVYGNCWGYQRGIQLTPAVITLITKRERREPDGTFKGVNYWVVTFSHNSEMDVILGKV